MTAALHNVRNPIATVPPRRQIKLQHVVGADWIADPRSLICARFFARGRCPRESWLPRKGIGVAREGDTRLWSAVGLQEGAGD